MKTLYVDVNEVEAIAIRRCESMINLSCGPNCIAAAKLGPPSSIAARTRYLQFTKLPATTLPQITSRAL